MLPPTLTAAAAAATHASAQLLMLITVAAIMFGAAAGTALSSNETVVAAAASASVAIANGALDALVTASIVETDSSSPSERRSSSSSSSKKSRKANGTNNDDNDNNDNNDLINDKIIATQSANLLLKELQHPGHIVNLTRQHDGDVFRTSGVTNCNMDTCVGLSSGTAGLMLLGGNPNVHRQRSSAAGLSLAAGPGDVGQASIIGRLGSTRAGKLPADAVGRSCDCRCLPYLSTYREDLGICVDDIHECTLSPFVSGSSSEKIPFVFLPLRGQIIYPSREISFPEIRTPVCAVTGSQYLTTNGWTDLRNPIDSDYPFRMFRDEGRTFLQWLGEPDLRHKMQGRLIVVHLVCRDMMPTLNASALKQDQLLPPKNVFSPCVAFRVNGSPVKYFHNVSEVLFQAEATTTLASATDGMTTREYVVIGVCSLLLGLIYVSSVFLYLHMKKRKNHDQSHMRSSLDDLANEINYPKNDQVTFGAPFTRAGSVYSAASLATSNEPRSRASIASAVGVHLKEEMGIVKNNPLLQHYPQLSEHHSGFASDISNSNSECETDGGGYHDKLKQVQTSALVHPNGAHCAAATGRISPGGDIRNGNESPGDRASSPTQDSECLPEENVSIVEDMMTEEKLEQMRQMVNGGTIRKKLYFNPAYFEPHLLAQPPPAAVEFLTKIREVISIAKYKMATKRYQPSLNVIPEEAALSSATASLYSSQLQMSGTDGCRGCGTNRCTGHAKDCGDKRNSIEKWLQTVSPHDSANASAGASTEPQSNGKQQQQQQQQDSKKQTEAAEHSPRRDRRCREQSLLKSSRINNRSPPQTRKEISAPKQRPPPPPAKPTAHNNSNRHSPTPSPSPSPSPSPPRPCVIEIRNNTPYEGSSNLQTNSGTSSCGSATTITVNTRDYNALAGLPTASSLYEFAAMGSEIYNNPKFVLHDSPVASQRSYHSSSHRSKSSRKRLDVLDQYAAASTPTSLTSADREHYEMLRNMKQGPDLVYDTISRDYSATLASSNGSFHLDIPTPDYDSTMEKKIKDVYSSSTALSSAPSVPTPDYSTLSKKSLRQCQPDSPIYRRKSPQYLIVDYETDSLERLNAAKTKSSQSSSSPSSDISSQLSPSLSTALPLEEELEINHTVFDNGANGCRHDGSGKQKAVTKAEKSGTKKEIEARIKYDTPFRGSMTIEVEHDPPSDVDGCSTDTDHYGRETLDRTQKKQSFCDINTWTDHLQKAKQFVNSSSAVEGQEQEEHVSYQSLQNMKNLPTVLASGSDLRREPLTLTRQHSADATYVQHVVLNECIHTRNSGKAQNRRASFDSIREIYQPKLIRQNIQAPACDQKTQKLIADAFTEKGRLLTLEAKHTRRQRVTALQPIPPEIETEVVENKTTIKIKTPNLNRTRNQSHAEPDGQPDISAPAAVASSINSAEASRSNNRNAPKGFYDLTKNLTGWNHNNSVQVPKRPSLPTSPPPPPPTSSTSTALNSHRSNAPSQQHRHSSNPQQQAVAALLQNQTPYLHQSTTATEEETASNHSESTEITRVSDTQATSEFDCSGSNTLNSVAPSSENREVSGNPKKELTGAKKELSGQAEKQQQQQPQSPPSVKKVQDLGDYGATYKVNYNGLRGDYSLTKYLNRRKSQDHQREEAPPPSSANSDVCNDAKTEAGMNNTKSTCSMSTDSDSNKYDVVSISSRSNRSSSRLSDRTKEMYRNAGVPVGIAYPQRSGSAGGNSEPSCTNVQTVYRCEIEPVQLTHGMQIAMGLKDRAKKAKDLKNAWKKFVSMAAAKFSPTGSPAPPFEKKNAAASFLEALERDDGISSLMEDPQQQASTPKSSYSAPASQNYYEQRFGAARLPELDSGYMSADSGEVYKRSFYDRYNFRMMAGRDRVIRVDTIEDNSDAASTTMARRHRRRNGVDDDDDDDGDHEGAGGGDDFNAEGGGDTNQDDISGPHAEINDDRNVSIIVDSNRFEENNRLARMSAAAEPAEEFVEVSLRRSADDCSDADSDSDKTLTRSNEQQRGTHKRGAGAPYSSSSSDDDERDPNASFGSSETDGETNADDLWESGAESIETHSVLYKKIQK